MTTHDKFGATIADDDYLQDGFYNGISDDIFSVVLGNPGHIYNEAVDTSGGAKTLTAGKTYRFPSMNIETNNLNLTGTSTLPTVFIVEGNVTISATIDGTGNGFAGGLGASALSQPGLDGSEHTITISAGEGGGHGGAASGGTVGAAGVFTAFTTTPTTIQKAFNVLPGAGGAGGGASNQDDNIEGLGGAGGAAIVIICKGDFDGSGGTIDVSGDAGGNGANDGAAGGGGGAGGMIVIAYGGTYTAATYTVAGGAGGTGHSGSTTGGAGGGGGDSVGGVASAGSANVTSTGGAGGAGSAGASYSFAINVDRG